MTRTPSPSSTTPHLVYTICPVLAASSVALELGWLEEELQQAGASLSYLRAEGGTDWTAHFNHDHDHLIRDGGNTPAIWARADVRRTVLLGLTQSQPGGKLLVGSHADLYRVEDLKGKRIGLYKSENTSKIDWRRATLHRSILQVLYRHGLTEQDVEWVDLSEADALNDRAAPRPSGIWRQRPERLPLQTPEPKALLSGDIDAFFTPTVGFGRALVDTGRFKVLDDLDTAADWTLRVGNAPWTLAVSEEFATRHREVVIAYLRAAIRAGEWINANPRAAADILLPTTFSASAEDIARILPRFDLVPNLSPQALAALSLQKDFLLEKGYIRHDFDVSKDWADPSYLEAAHASLR